MTIKAKIMDDLGVARALVRISHEIVEKNCGTENVVLLGIKTRGVPIAKRIAANIKNAYGEDIPVGILDITLYRDDLSVDNDSAIINSTDIPFEIASKRVILIDDVLFTGRTVRAAIEGVMQLGRPSVIQLGVLVDRGHRELPIRADYVGKNLPTSLSEIVSVNLTETDNEDSVLLYDMR